MNVEIERNFGLVPLYIGITGHRDIRDEDKPGLKQ